MLEFHAQIKAVHVACVLLSVSLFALRGALMLARRDRLALALPLRVASWSIDTLLLSAALLLLTILPGALFANHWLTLKLGLLVPYVLCGRLALRRGLRTAPRLGWLGAALAALFLMYGIARAHHPLGWLLLLG